MPLNKRQKELIKLAEKKATDMDLLLFDKLNDLADIDRKEMSNLRGDIKEIKNSIVNLDKVLASVKWKQGEKGAKGDSIKGDKGDKPIVGIDFKIPKDGKDGKTPIKGIDYVDGKDAIDGLDGKDVNEEKIIENILKDLPHLGKAVRDGLEDLKGKQRLEPSAIVGLEKTLEDIKGKIKKVRLRPAGFGIGPINTVQFADLTSQCDGSTTTFSVPTHRHAVMLVGTQFPIIYRPTTDFTTGNKTLDLVTTEVSAPKTGQTLLFLYIK